MRDTIEVFKDLTVAVADRDRSALREDLVGSTATPWKFDIELSDEIARHNVSSTDLMVFTRQEDVTAPAVFLTLWANSNGYYVSNIVPIGRSQLSRREYNELLDDFAARVMRPAAERLGLAIVKTEAEQKLTDWLSVEAATCLRRFSCTANKSTGASHPSDRRRWFDFIIQVHRSGDKISTDRLARWLQEVDGWDAETAHDLSADFEVSLGLLRHYDEN